MMSEGFQTQYLSQQLMHGLMHCLYILGKTLLDRFHHIMSIAATENKAQYRIKQDKQSFNMEV